jgi:hypothetical protein
MIWAVTGGGGRDPWSVNGNDTGCRYPVPAMALRRASASTPSRPQRSPKRAPTPSAANLCPGSEPQDAGRGADEYLLEEAVDPV